MTTESEGSALRIRRDYAQAAASLVEILGATVATPVGTMNLLGYLPSRTVELAVHGLDLVQTTGVPQPGGLAGPLIAAAEIAVQLGIDSGQVKPILLALTGRTALPEGFSVV